MSDVVVLLVILIEFFSTEAVTAAAALSKDLAVRQDVITDCLFCGEPINRDDSTCVAIHTFTRGDGGSSLEDCSVYCDLTRPTSECASFCSSK